MAEARRNRDSTLTRPESQTSSPLQASPPRPPALRPGRREAEARPRQVLIRTNVPASVTLRRLGDNHEWGGRAARFREGAGASYPFLFTVELGPEVPLFRAEVHVTAQGRSATCDLSARSFRVMEREGEAVFVADLRVRLELPEY